MLPLRSQFYSLGRDRTELNKSVGLEQNRIRTDTTLTHDSSAPMPCVNRNLLGGILLLSDISFKETTPLAQSITHFSTNVVTYFHSDFDDANLCAPDSRVSVEKSSKYDHHRCCFGNPYYSTFRTNRAQIPIWGDGDDLSEIFLPTNSFTIESRPKFTNKPCAPRQSIIRKRRRSTDILDIQKKISDSAAATDPKNTTISQMIKWGIVNINALRSSDETAADHSVYSMRSIPCDFIEMPLVEDQRFDENEKFPLHDSGLYCNTWILAKQLTSKLLLSHFHDDFADVLPMQAIKNLTLFKADPLMWDMPNIRQSLFVDLCQDKEGHSPSQQRSVFISPWDTLQQDIGSFAAPKTVFQDLVILHPNLFQLSQSGRSEGLTRLDNGSISKTLLYCSLILGKNISNGMHALEEDTDEVGKKEMHHLHDKDLDISQFRENFILLKKDRERSMRDTGFLKERILSSTHALHCIPIVPHSRNIGAHHGDLLDLQSPVEAEEMLSLWTWQPLQARKLSVLRVMKMLRSRLSCLGGDKHKLGRDCYTLVQKSSSVGQPQNCAHMQLKTDSIPYASKSLLNSMLHKDRAPILDGIGYTTDINNGMGIEQDSENRLTRFVRFAFLPATSQQILTPSTIEAYPLTEVSEVSKKKEVIDLRGEVGETAAVVQTIECLSNRFEIDEQSQLYNTLDSNNGREVVRKAMDSLCSDKPKECLRKDLTCQAPNAPVQILSASSANNFLPALNTDASLYQNSPNIMSEQITQSLDLDQMVSCYLVMHGSPQALLTKPILTPKTITPKNTAVRRDTMSLSVERLNHLHAKVEGVNHVHEKVTIITPGNEAPKCIERNDNLEKDYKSADKLVKFDGLRILISETFMESAESSLTISTLAERYGILCVDTLLEDPITFIIDSATAICVVKADLIGHRQTLKEFVKQLTLLVYKFTCIWIIVNSHYHDTTEECREGAFGDEGVAMMQLYAAISRFPVDVIVRSIASSDEPLSQSSRDTKMGKLLAKLVYHICNDTANVVCLHQNIIRETFVSRNFLTSLLCMNSFAFTEHCDFLQQFPSLNFYSAAQILTVTTLQDIASHLPDKIIALKEKLLFVPSISDYCLNSFFALYSLHCGLEKSSSTTVIALLDDGEGIESPPALDHIHQESKNVPDNRSASLQYATSIEDDNDQYYPPYNAQHGNYNYDQYRGKEGEHDIRRHDKPHQYSGSTFWDNEDIPISRSSSNGSEVNRSGSDNDYYERGGKKRKHFDSQVEDYSTDFFDGDTYSRYEDSMYTDGSRATKSQARDDRKIQVRRDRDWDTRVEPQVRYEEESTWQRECEDQGLTSRLMPSREISDRKYADGNLESCDSSSVYNTGYRTSVNSSFTPHGDPKVRHRSYEAEQQQHYRPRSQLPPEGLKEQIQHQQPPQRSVSAVVGRIQDPRNFSATKR